MKYDIFLSCIDALFYFGNKFLTPSVLGISFMMKNVFVSVALLSFAFSGLQCADSGAGSIGDISIRDMLSEFSLNQDLSANPLLDFVDSTEVREDLLSKEYKEMGYEEISKNEEIIEKLAGDFKRNFFPGKNNLNNEDRRVELNKLFDIANNLKLHSALAAIVELRTQPWSVFNVKLLKAGNVKGLSDLLRSRMIKRIEQRYYNYSGDQYNLMVNYWREYEGEYEKFSKFIVVSPYTPLRFVKNRVCEKLELKGDVNSFKLLCAGSSLEDQMDKEVRKIGALSPNGFDNLLTLE